MADVDSIQVIYIEATLTKCKMWIICGLCGFANFRWCGLNVDYVDSLVSWKQYVDYMWLLWILRYYFQNKLLIWLNVALCGFIINKSNMKPMKPHWSHISEEEFVDFWPKQKTNEALLERMASFQRSCESLWTYQWNLICYPL